MSPIVCFCQRQPFRLIKIAGRLSAVFGDHRVILSIRIPPLLSPASAGRQAPSVSTCRRMRGSSIFSGSEKWPISNCRKNPVITCGRMPYEHSELTLSTRFSGLLSAGNCASISGGFGSSQVLTEFFLCFLVVYLGGREQTYLCRRYPNFIEFWFSWVFVGH